jgi:hypothetical protein
MGTKKGKLARLPQTDPGYEPGKWTDIDFSGKKVVGSVPDDATLNQWEGAFARDEVGESAASALKLTIDAVRHLKRVNTKLREQIAALSKKPKKAKQEEKESE